MPFDDLWTDDPTVAIPHEPCIELALADPHGHLPLARGAATPARILPPSLTETREIPIPPELLAFTT